MIKLLSIPSERYSVVNQKGYNKMLKHENKLAAKINKVNQVAIDKPFSDMLSEMCSFK
jgi:hypothetical protein